MVSVPPVEAGTPPWFQRWALALQTSLRQPDSAPLRLFAQPTANLPPAAKWTGSLMYDLTLGQVVYSDGSAWNAL